MITPLTIGMPGEPLPYLPNADWMITTLLFFCILLTSFAFSKEKKYLLQQIKTSLSSRERSSMFDESAIGGSRYSFLLKIHTTVLLGFYIYHYYASHLPLLFEKVPHIALLAGFIVAIGIFILLKCTLYQSINWIFFQKVRNSIWIESFFNIYIWTGILMLPLVLLIVYFNISSTTSLILVGALIIFAKIALFWKCFSNFFEKIHGALHLILYFCALEILPDLILWKGIELMSNNLILKL